MMVQLQITVRPQKLRPPQAMVQIQTAVAAVEKIRQVLQAFHSKF
jgi:hypothetical protein